MSRDAERDAVIDGALQLAGSHLGLDVSFVSQLTGAERVLRNVHLRETDPPDHRRPTPAVGDTAPREESYCHHVAQGTLPQFLLDPRRHPVAAGLAVTEQLPVGTHLSVPLRSRDGSVYGTFCGFSHRVLPHLGEGDLIMMRRLAATVAAQIEETEAARQGRQDRREHLVAMVPGQELLLARQPIFALDDGAVRGFEMLARFPTVGRPPDEVFAEAWRLGVGGELELAAARRAFDVLGTIAAGSYLAVNASPATLLDPRFLEAASAAGPGELVVEITEHAPVDDYPALLAAIRRLRAAGIRLAIDDIGTGFSGLDRILRLEPQLLKLDGALIRDLDRRRGARAMVAALVGYAGEVGVPLIAEQIESRAELAVLRDLGVRDGQGYLLARPELERPDPAAR